MTGRFVVLEGIDGCGKTTQLNYLANWLPQSGIMPSEAKLHLTREPGGTPLGIALRELLLQPPEEKSPDELAELLLYAADRAQHVSQLILPALYKGDWVLSDRFSGSTIAYQGYGRGLDLDLIRTLEKIATAGLVPDLTIWLELSVEESVSRRKSKLQDRMESEGLEFLKRVASGFSVLAEERNWLKVQADKEYDFVSGVLENEILRVFGDCREAIN